MGTKITTLIPRVFSVETEIDANDIVRITFYDNQTATIYTQHGLTTVELEEERDGATEFYPVEVWAYDPTTPDDHIVHNKGKEVVEAVAAVRAPMLTKATKAGCVNWLKTLKLSHMAYHPDDAAESVRHGGSRVFHPNDCIMVDAAMATCKALLGGDIYKYL